MDANDPFETDVEVNITSGAHDACDSSTWIIDSGSSHHVAHDLSLFRDYRKYRFPRPVRVGGGRQLGAHGEGAVQLAVATPTGEALLALREVLFVPEMQRHLV